MDDKKDLAERNVKIFVRILPITTVCDCLLKIGENKKVG